MSSVKINPKVSKRMDVAVSIAAAVVIFGALQKILHTAIADLFLQIGLYTEAAIFAMYGIIYWKAPLAEDAHEAKPINPMEAMDKMMKEADINPANMKKLGEGFQKLNSVVSNIGEVGDVVKSTTDFGAKTKEAATAMTGVATAANASAASMNNFSSASQSAKGFHDQVQVLTKNLSSLNTIYELELKESNNHLKSLNQFYGKLAEASQSMTATVDDAKKAKEQIAALATNLSKLNSVYGAMITAMQGR